MSPRVWLHKVQWNKAGGGQWAWEQSQTPKEGVLTPFKSARQSAVPISDLGPLQSPALQQAPAGCRPVQTADCSKLEARAGSGTARLTRCDSGIVPRQHFCILQWIARTLLDSSLCRSLLLPRVRQCCNACKAVKPFPALQMQRPPIAIRPLRIEDPSRLFFFLALLQLPALIHARLVNCVCSIRSISSQSANNNTTAFDSKRKPTRSPQSPAAFPLYCRKFEIHRREDRRPFDQISTRHTHCRTLVIHFHACTCHNKFLHLHLAYSRFKVGPSSRMQGMRVRSST